MKIREASDDDAEEIYYLHIASIEHYCRDHYSKASITEWTSSKSPSSYKNLSTNYKQLVGIVDSKIVGFGLLNLETKSIDSLYLKPDSSGKGYGKELLVELEKIAQENNVRELNLSSTLNARDFYHHMGFVGNDLSSFQLKSGASLDCIKMTKKL
jgi:N-acetylglutamate synthase-like GNAT family acetyltransferase